MFRYFKNFTYSTDSILLFVTQPSLAALDKILDLVVGKPGRRIRAISAAVNKIFIEIVVSNEQNDQYTYKTLHNSQKIR